MKRRQSILVMLLSLIGLSIIISTTIFVMSRKSTPVEHSKIVPSSSSVSQQSQINSTSSQPSQSDQHYLVDQSLTTSSGLTNPNLPIPQEVIDNSSQQVDNKREGGIKYLLDVKHQVQRAWNTCAPTTVSMILSSQGIEVSQEVLAEEMGTDTSFGTHNADAIRVLNRYLFGYDIPVGDQAGYRLATVTTADPNSEQMRLFKEHLKQNIADGYPLYYTFDTAKVYPGSKGEHNVIGIGYQLSEDGTDIAYIYYIDPSYTKQDATYGGLKKITPIELFEAMLTCVEPNYAW